MSSIEHVDDSDGLESSDAQWLLDKRVMFSELPEPGVEWVVRDFDFHRSKLWPLRTRGIIRKTGKTKRGTTQVNTYTTTKKGYETLSRFLEQDQKSDGLLPCGHNSFINHGDTLKCKRCGATHDKSEVRS